eukprot:414989_1
MTDLEKPKGPDQLEQQDWRRIRITLTSRNVKNDEEVTARLVAQAKKKEKLTVKGPVRLPKKRLRVTCIKSPCGEGKNTWDRWQMRIHKRLLDIHSPPHMVREITKKKRTEEQTN